jgi:hypothetical protein
MTKNDLVQQVQRELDTSFALPAQLQPEEIERIISQELVWFYDNYREAVETQYYIIKNSEFQSPDFRANRTILMPECVVSVFEVKEITGAGLLGTVDRDFADNKLIASEIYLSPFLGDGLVYRIAQYQFYDLTKAFFMDLIRFDFNRRTKKLKILGRDPRRDVFIQTYVGIPEDKLFEDYYFFRMVTAKAKLSLARQLSFFDFNLMGGIRINVSDLRSEADAEIQKIEQEIKDQDTPDYFFVWHAFIPPLLMITSLLNFS